jgi:hypothetical protein
MRAFELIQILGALLNMGAFALLHFEIAPSSALRYLIPNWVGSVLLVISAYAGGQWGFLMLEGAWVLVTGTRSAYGSRGDSRVRRTDSGQGSSAPPSGRVRVSADGPDDDFFPDPRLQRARKVARSSARGALAGISLSGIDTCLGDGVRNEGPAERAGEQGGARLRAGTGVPSVAIAPFQSAILRLHEAVGNRAVAGLLGRSAVRISSPSLVSVVQRKKFEELRTDGSVVYRDPPLDESEARKRIEQIERNDPAAFKDLLSQGEAYEETAARAASHEWGLGTDNKGSGEAVLIVGDKKDVNWSDYLECVTPIAHSHPYFKNKEFPGGRHQGLRSGVAMDTKEIATRHDIAGRTVDGAVAWSDLVSKKENNEMLKIFPSASDITFSAKKQLARHTVYTTYRVLEHPAAKKVILNPDFKIGAEQADDPFAADKVAATPRLRFEIKNAAPLDNESVCDMEAFAGDVQFWTGRVRTEKQTYLAFL